MRAKSNGHLDEAMANVIQAQAAFLARASEIDARFAENDASFRETQRQSAECFARVEALLLKNNRLLLGLPYAICEKMGIKPARMLA